MWPNTAGWCTSPCCATNSNKEDEVAKRIIPLAGVPSDDPSFEPDGPKTPRAADLRRALSLEKHSITITTQITSKAVVKTKTSDPSPPVERSPPPPAPALKQQKSKKEEKPPKKKEEPPKKKETPPKKGLEAVAKVVKKEEAKKVVTTEAKEPKKVEAKEPEKVEAKEPEKVEAKEPEKVEAKEPEKVEAKEPEKKVELAEYPEDITLYPIPPLKPFDTFSESEKTGTKDSLSGLMKSFAESANSGNLKCCVITKPSILNSKIEGNALPFKIYSLPADCRKHCSFKVENHFANLSVIEEANQTPIIDKIDIKNPSRVILTGEELKHEYREKYPMDGGLGETFLPRLMAVKVEVAPDNIEVLESQQGSYVMLAFYNVKDSYLTNASLRVLALQASTPHTGSVMTMLKKNDPNAGKIAAELHRKISQQPLVAVA